MGSSSERDAVGGSLPAIGGHHTLVPAPTPPSIASKSRLKPPSQRTVLLASLAKTPIASGDSPLKLPSLVKPSVVLSKPAEAAPGNQEAELEARHDVSNRSVLSSGPRCSVVDKHRDFIKELEEQKRKEKDAQAKQDARRRKLQKKLTEKILYEAALARQKQEEEPIAAEPEVASPEETVECKADDEEKRQRDKEAKRQRKRLLKKQQALLETLQTKQREKLDEEEQEQRRERRRQRKLKQAVLAAIHASHTDGDSAAVGEEEPGKPQYDASPSKSVLVEEEPFAVVDNQERDTPTKKKAPGTEVDRLKKQKKKKRNELKVASADYGLTRPDSDAGDSAEAAESTMTDSALPELRPRTKESVSDAELLGVRPARVRDKSDAVHKKQHDYLAKLAEQKRLKQKEDEDLKLTQEKRRRRVQLEAQQRLQEAAAKQQQRLLEEQQAAAEQEPADDEKKVVVDVDAMVARLSKLKDKDALVVPEARDFASWKKRHGVGSHQKVFSMTGWYPVIREALEARGWFYNDDRTSPFFDLKWSLKSDDLKSTKLKDEQFVNHFFNNTAITTKVGLLHTLRNLPWQSSVDVDDVFPRAYDLNEPRDMDAFTMDFRYTFAEGVLKQVVDRIMPASRQSVRMNEAFVAVLLSVGRKKLRAKRHRSPSSETVDAVQHSEDPLDESVDEPLSGGAEDLVSELEWEVLTKHQLDAPGKFRASLTYKRRVVVDAERDPLTVPGDPTSTVPVVDTVLSALEKKQQQQLERLRAVAFDREKTMLSDRLSRVSVPSPATCDELLELMQSLREACPQFALNGSSAASRNIWIVKPAGLSRGRGIRVFNDLPALLAYADVEHHKECQWVAQKYIENPLLLCNRKFDIRQWVLVTSWDPLTVWMYDDFYLRFSSEPYSTEDLSDQYVHLTNNSIQKYSDKFRDVYTADDGALRVEGNMLHSDAFRAHLRRTRALDDAAFERTLHARMKDLVVQSLQCAQDLVTHRRNACELYGYDFMLDETLRPWLIEVNSSPACDYSTPTAQRYVETGLRGIVQVIVDHREFEARKKNGYTEPEPATGQWRRIHRGEFVGKPVAALGADLQVKGTRVQRTRKAKARAISAKADKGLDEELLDLHPEDTRPEEPHPEDPHPEGDVDPEDGDGGEEDEVTEETEDREEQALHDGDASVDSLL